MKALLEIAVSYGVGVNEFWRMSPAAVYAQIQGARKRTAEQGRAQEYYAWMYGLYVRHAMHGKKYPEPPPVQKRQELPGAMSEEQMKAVMRGLAKRGR